MAIAWPDFIPEVDGERRLIGSRVTPWVLLHFYNSLGYSVEMLASEFPSVSLPVIHKFLAFYIENTTEMDSLAAAEDSAIDQMRAASQDHVTLTAMRRRLATRPLSA
jgi:uncharacterized protein (DUF433 family)